MRSQGAAASQSQTDLPHRALRSGKSVLLSGASAAMLAVTLTFALGADPASARMKINALHREADRNGNEPFGNVPKGPVQIFVSIDQQKLHVYSDGTHVADTSVATGVPRLPTPTGVFSVIQKQVFHRSNLYSNAPMPFMQRITWSGVALHEGENIGHPASHGCIRMPGEFAARLYKFTRIGARVIVARGELKPADFADPHLFVHRDIQAAAVPDAATVKTAQSADGGKASDAAPVAKPFDLGLRGARPSVPASFVVAASDGGSAAKSDALSDPAKPAAAVDAPKSDAQKSAGQKSDALKPDVPAMVPVIAAPEASPAKPADAVPPPVIKKTPIAIFISRKERKIFIRQDFEPIFEEAITIEHPEEPMGTHVFTALELLPDNSTFRWNVVSMPAESAKAAKPAHMIAEQDGRDYYYYDRFYVRHVVRHKHKAAEPAAAEMPAPQSPQQVLARIALPQDAIDFISQRMVPGSSLIVSDHGLGEETGEGTDFIVVTR